MPRQFFVLAMPVAIILSNNHMPLGVLLDIYCFNYYYTRCTITIFFYYFIKQITQSFFYYFIKQIHSLLTILLTHLFLKIAKLYEQYKEVLF